MMRFRRRIEGILSEGQGKQLLLLTLLVLIVLAILLVFGGMYGVAWQKVLAVYLDPGVYAGPHETHETFWIIVALLGVFLFSGLLISVFINIIGNVAGAHNRGDNRYRFSGHILIIGASMRLLDMLEGIRNHPELSRKEILVMTDTEVISLRDKIQASLADKRFCRKLSFYHCNRVSRKHLEEACVEKAELVYLIGEDYETNHDALNLKCLDLLREICSGPGPAIQVYMTVERHSTLDIIRYVKKGENSRLSVDVIHEGDYIAEQVLVHTDVLPALTSSDTKKNVRIVISGDSSMARSFARVASQICHYPNFCGNAPRTQIVFMGEGIRNMMDAFLLSHPGLAVLCHHSYLSAGTQQSCAPKAEYGDFLDQEWTFVDAALTSPYARTMLETWANNPSEKLVMALCGDDDATNVAAAVHLPRAVYESGCPILVYQHGDPTLVSEAKKTGMFGNLIPFGERTLGTDVLFLRRTTLGKRVNRVYDLEYGHPSAVDADAAWKSLPQAHKLSSIASANFFPVILRCFGLEPTKDSFTALSDEQLDAISEVEHRRWMSSVLILGYAPANKGLRTDRSQFKYLKNERFIHLDIAPYKELSHDQEKDLLIVSRIPYILTGNE